MKQQAIWLLGLTVGLSAAAADLRIGIIGCDTSHVTAFAEALNNAEGKAHVTGGRIVAAFKGGSPDLPQSASRVEGFAKTLREKYGVTFCDSIEALCTNVDVVMLESVDGRVHLAQAKPVIAAHKPLFIDKPMASSLPEVLEIFRLAKAANVPVWSSSSLRFAKNTQAVRLGQIGKVQHAETFSPCEVEEHHPELFWYGIHGVESLYTAMGTGCESVQRQVVTNGAIEVVGTWRGGRTGIYRQDLAKKYGGLAKGSQGELAIGSYDGYAPLLVEIIKFFQTGVPPVSAEETVELFTFMTAAQQSKDLNGAVVQLSDVRAKLASAVTK